MLSLKQIERLVHTQAHRRLIQRILANGRCQSPRIVNRLLEPWAAAPAALGLALQRQLELSWGPSLETSLILHRLLACQQATGLFGAEGPAASSEDTAARENARLAATAVTLRALHTWRRRMLQRARSPRSNVMQHVEAALRHGTEALKARLDIGAIDCRDETTLAIILWQCADLDEVVSRTDRTRLAAKLESRAATSRLGDLFDYARASAA